MSEKYFTLDKDELLEIGGGCAFEVCIRHGEVWLTQHKDENDYVLEAGAILPLNGKGTTLIKAYRPTMIRVRDADPAPTQQLQAQRKRLMRNNRVLASAIYFLGGGRA